MKTLSTLPLLFVLIGLLCVTAALSQEAATETPQPEITQKDDRLPFMSAQDGENAAPAEPGSGTLVLKSIGAMALVLGLIFIGAWGAKKLGFGNLKAAADGDPIGLKILSTVGTGSGRTIAAVSFAGRVLLVGSTAHSFTLLAEEGKETPGAETRPRSVAELLREEASFEDELEFALLSNPGTETV